MEKKILALLFLLILIPAIYAITIKDTLKPKESIVLRDKNVTLISTTDDSIKVCVNGELAIVSKSSRTVNGVFINIISSSNREARLELSYSCTNCVCDESCDNTICLNECETDLDCIDGNRSTIDKCVSIPKICVHEPIKPGEKETAEEEVIPISLPSNQQIQQINEKEQVLIEEISQKQDMLIMTTIIASIVIVILVLIVLIKKR